MINKLKLKRDLKQLDCDENLQLREYEIAPNEEEEVVRALESYRLRIRGKFDNKRRHLVAGFLLRKAEKKLIPRPEFNKQNWIKDEDDCYYLSDSAINDLRSKIMTENKESIRMIIEIIAAITGIIGVFVGLVAVINK